MDHPLAVARTNRRGRFATGIGGVIIRFDGEPSRPGSRTWAYVKEPGAEIALTEPDVSNHVRARGFRPAATEISKNLYKTAT